MQPKELHSKTLKSNALLDLAKENLARSEALPQGNPEKQRLEEEAKILFEKAKQLTDEAKSEVNKLTSKFGF